MSPDFDTRSYIRQIAGKIRVKEADMLRGKPEQLAALEQRTDIEVVVRWAWTSAIIGAIGAFLVAPFVLAFLDRLLPGMLVHILWLILKLAMFAVILMFAAAVWLTVKPPEM